MVNFTMWIKGRYMNLFNWSKRKKISKDFQWPYSFLTKEELDKKIKYTEELLQKYGAEYIGESHRIGTRILNDGSKVYENIEKNIWKRENEFIRVDWVYFSEKPFLLLEFSDKQEGPYEDGDPFPYDLANEKFEQEIRDCLGIKEAIIIYLDDGMILSKKKYSSWIDVQEEYYDKYKANLSPMTCEEVIQFFKEDFKEEENWPFSRNDIVEFFNSDDLVIYSYD